DELSLLRFLHSLCDFLPASHDIQPLERPRSHAGSLAQTLQTEIHSVTQDVEERRGGVTRLLTAAPDAQGGVAYRTEAVQREAPPTAGQHTL
ncbi:hypothetical protein M9458_020934, partial [Cirrhinus mrigala]